MGAFRAIDQLTAEHIDMILGLFEGLGMAKDSQASAKRLAEIMVGDRDIAAVNEARRSIVRIEELFKRTTDRMNEIQTLQEELSKKVHDRLTEVDKIESQMHQVLKQMDEMRELVGIANDTIGAFS